MLRRPKAAVGIPLGLLLALVVLMLGAKALYAGGGRLALEVQPDLAETDVTATLTDARGRPVADAEITFLRRTAFGWLEVARAATDTDGRARTVLDVPASPGIELQATAAIGEDVLSQTVRADGNRLPPVPTRPGEADLSALVPQPGFVSPYPPARLLLALMPVLVGVWATYAVVVYQLYGIARNR